MVANVKITSVENNIYNIDFSKDADFDSLGPQSLFTHETVKEPISNQLLKNIQL